jgi:hypothetical protein
MGNWREAPQETLAALAAAMGQPPLKAKRSVIVVRRGLRRPLRHPAQVMLENGAVLRFDKAGAKTAAARKIRASLLRHDWQRCL